MNSIFYRWLMPGVLRFTATRRHTMDDLAFGSGALSDRCRRQQLRDLVPGFDEDPDDPSWPDLPPEPIVPTPTDVPVPEEFDAPFPEPIDVPPPKPRDVPPPQRKRRASHPKPRNIP